MRERRLPSQLSILDVFIMMVGLVFAATSVLNLLISANVQQSNRATLRTDTQILKELRQAVAYPNTPAGRKATEAVVQRVADEFLARLSKQPTKVIVVPGRTRTIIVERTRTVTICRLPNGRPC